MTNDRLRSLLLTHWQNYHPKMLAELQKENLLEEHLEATTNRFANLMYELVVVKKMSYSSAWEIAIEQFLLPEEPEEETSNQSQSQNQNENPQETLE